MRNSRTEKKGVQKEAAEKSSSWAEIGLQGSAVGVILWCSSILYLSLTQNTEGMVAFMPWMLPALMGYMAAGIILQWAFFNKQMIGGLSAFYWTFILMLGVSVLAGFIKADWIRMMILTAFIVLVGIFALNYYLLGRVAKELNGNRMPLSLCIGLKEKPASREEFFVKFEEYCVKERIDLTYETRDFPAIVQMNGRRCEIKLDSMPGLGGADYFIKVTEL